QCVSLMSVSCTETVPDVWAATDAGTTSDATSNAIEATIRRPGAIELRMVEDMGSSLLPLRTRLGWGASDPALILVKSTGPGGRSGTRIVSEHRKGVVTPRERPVMYLSPWPELLRPAA